MNAIVTLSHTLPTVYSQSTFEAVEDLRHYGIDYEQPLRDYYRRSAEFRMDHSLYMYIPSLPCNVGEGAFTQHLIDRSYSISIHI